MYNYRSGLGFIPCLAYKQSLNKMLVFEIDEKIIKNLRSNLNKNFCKFVILNKCLEFSQSTNHINFI